MSRWADLVSKPAREMGGTVPDFSPLLLASGKPAIKLDSNENPFGPSPRAIEAMRVALASGHSYPDNACAFLRCRLAEIHNVDPRQILIAPGSTGVLSLLCQTLLAPGLNAVTSGVSFILYGMVVRAVGAQLIETPLRDDGFDLNAILHAINTDTRLVFLANPNNPTGTMLSANEIDEFLKAIPDHVVVALDEAYCDFASHFAALRHVEYSRSLDYVRNHVRNQDRLVVLRTFSKAHGLAGLRIGYGMGPAELLGYCARMAKMYSVSSIAQAAALAALDDRDHVARAVSNNAQQAQVLLDGLTQMGCRVVPTSANFVYFDGCGEASAFAERLRDAGIFVRPLKAWGAPSGIRVTIGTPEQNQSFLDAARKLGGSR